ncbi:MAG: hypothetical protein ACKPE3_37610, partial [Sphaerospermopsis kisseleviana]
MIILEQLSVDIAIAIEHAILLEQAQESQQKIETEITERTAMLEQTNLQLIEELVERTRVETELTKTQRKLAGILDVADDAIICIDRYQKITLFY